MISYQLYSCKVRLFLPVDYVRKSPTTIFHCTGHLFSFLVMNNALIHAYIHLNFITQHNPYIISYSNKLIWTNCISFPCELVISCHHNWNYKGHQHFVSSLHLLFMMCFIYPLAYSIDFVCSV